MVVFKDPGAVPENWKPVGEEENLETGTSTTFSDHTPEALSSTQPPDGLERRPPVGYCTRCQNGKPPRCHHCSVCMHTFLFLLLLGMFVRKLTVNLLQHFFHTFINGFFNLHLRNMLFIL